MSDNLLDFGLPSAAWLGEFMDLLFLMATNWSTVDARLSYFCCSSLNDLIKQESTNREIIYDLPFINIRKVLREVLKTEGPCKS